MLIPSYLIVAGSSRRGERCVEVSRVHGVVAASVAAARVVGPVVAVGGVQVEVAAHAAHPGVGRLLPRVQLVLRGKLKEELF